MVFFQRTTFLFIVACLLGMSVQDVSTCSEQRSLPFGGVSFDKMGVRVNFDGNEIWLEELISQDVISQKVKDFGRMLNADYEGHHLTIIMVMKGAFCFAADLIRQLHIPCSVECIRASSYGYRGVKRGKLTIVGLDDLKIKSQHVLVVDDIFDSGNTLVGIIDQLKEKQPKSLKTLVLLSKNVTRTIDYIPDYVMFNVEDRFVVGCGLDYKEYYRGLPGVYAVVQRVYQRK